LKVSGGIWYIVVAKYNERWNELSRADVSLGFGQIMALSGELRVDWREGGGCCCSTHSPFLMPLRLQTDYGKAVFKNCTCVEIGRWDHTVDIQMFEYARECLRWRILKLIVTAQKA
jgi:hypothetical protein